MKEIGVGIIGFGFMGKTHTYGYRTIPLYYDRLPFRIRLVGVCDASREVAETAKETLGFEFATTDPEAILARDDVQVVDVCTPNVFHKDAVLKALAAGKHVYCDKPLAATAAEAREIVSALEGSRSVTQMALQYRFFPVTMRARELIDEGRIGTPLSFRIQYLHSGSVDATKPIGWKQDRKMGGGGVLFDLGSHALDLAYFLLGEFADVQARTRILYPQRPDRTGKWVDVDADDLAIVVATMRSGAVGTIEASKIATGANDEMRVELHGDRGALRFDLMEPNYLEFYDNTLPERPLGGMRGYTRIECCQRFDKPGGAFPSSKFSIGWIRAHVHSLYSFLACVDADRPASPSFRDGAYIQEVMERAYESDATSQRVRIG